MGVTQIQSSVDQINTAISDLASATHLALLTDDVAALDAKVDALSIAVDGLTLSIPDLASELSDLSALVAANEVTAEAFRSHLLQTKIEFYLAQKIEPMSVLYLPTEHGGQLQFVRDIVIAAISNNAAAFGDDFDDSQALDELDKGDDDFAAGDYKKAYEQYAKAYEKTIN